MPKRKSEATNLAVGDQIHFLDSTVAAEYILKRLLGSMDTEAKHTKNFGWSRILITKPPIIFLMTPFTISTIEKQSLPSSLKASPLPANSLTSFITMLESDTRDHSMQRTPRKKKKPR